MRSNRLVPGVILVLIGGLFLLHNYGYVHFHWMNFLYLWPIFIVIGGVNLIFAHNKSVWATVIKLTVVVLGFGLVLFGNFGNRYRFWPHHTYTYSDDNDDNDEDDDDSTSTKNGVTKVEGNSFFNEPYTADVRVARLTISGGATSYKLSDTTNQLFVADSKEYFGKYEFTHSKEDSVYVLDFSMKDNGSHHMVKSLFDHKSDKSNYATFKLNPLPEWEIDIEAGATDLNFDLAKFKVKTLSLSGGMGDFNIKMGQPLASTKIDVSTGMSDVNLQVPQSAACRITTDSGLSSTNFDGFTKKDDDTYETPGFATAKNKMYISIDGGVSSFKVSRY